MVRGTGDRHDAFIRQPGHDAFPQPGVLEGEPALPLVIVCGQDPFEAAEGATPVDGVGQAFTQALVAYHEDEVLHVAVRFMRLIPRYPHVARPETTLDSVGLLERVAHPVRHVALPDRPAYTGVV